MVLDLLQWGFSAAFVIAGVYFGQKYYRTIGSGTNPGPAPRELRQKTLLELKKHGERLENNETAEFLLAISVDLYERKFASYRALDTKGQTLIALIGAGAGLYAVVGGLSGSLGVQISPMLVLSAGCFLASLVMLLVSIHPRSTNLPGITRFNTVGVLNDAAMRPRIAFRLIEAWAARSFELTSKIREKARCIFVATVLIVAGVSLLLVNFLLVAGLRNAPRTADIKCFTSPMPNNQVAIQCTGDKK